MTVLILNPGSTSLKYKLFSDELEELYSGGYFQEGDRYYFKDNSEHKEITKEEFENSASNIHNSLSEEPIKIGYRVVHGGDKYSQPVEIDNDVIKTIDTLSKFAPLHNPPALNYINKFIKVFKNSKHLAVFDTAFHTSLPEKAYLYGLPYKFYKEYGIRKFGFHGISYAYVASTLKELDPSSKKNIICHIGGGVSVCAVENGKSIDTSMGFSPNEGAIMATRSGGIDFGIIKYMNHDLEMNIDEIDYLTNFESGLKGVSEITEDMVELLDLYKSNDDRAKRAIDLFVYRITKIIGSYASAMNGVDSITFTGGIGAGSDIIRKMIIDNLNYLGFKLSRKNTGKINVKENIKISIKSSKPIWVIPTDEELQIAKEISLL